MNDAKERSFIRMTPKSARLMTDRYMNVPEYLSLRITGTSEKSSPGKNLYGISACFVNILVLSFVLRLRV